MKQNLRQLMLFGVLLFVTAGCASSKKMHTQTVPDQDYQRALAATDPAQFDLPAPGSSEEAAMLDRVEALFTNYTIENLSSNLGEVYADEFYFRDAFKAFTALEPLKEYFLHGFQSLEGAEFVFNNIARSGGDFYIDWTMRLDFKKTPTGTWEESIGVTRMRFNNEGKVIFHQDYWDPTDIVYRRIPIARGMIAFVKGKM